MVSELFLIRVQLGNKAGNNIIISRFYFTIYLHLDPYYYVNHIFLFFVFLIMHTLRISIRAASVPPETARMFIAKNSTLY